MMHSGMTTGMRVGLMGRVGPCLNKTACAPPPDTPDHSYLMGSSFLSSCPLDGHSPYLWRMVSFTHPHVPPPQVLQEVFATSGWVGSVWVETPHHHHNQQHDNSNQQNQHHQQHSFDAGTKGPQPTPFSNNQAQQQPQQQQQAVMRGTQPQPTNTSDPHLMLHDSSESGPTPLFPSTNTVRQQAANRPLPTWHEHEHEYEVSGACAAAATGV